jgi:hypothetical protein
VKRQAARAYDGHPVTRDELSELISAPQVLQHGVPARRNRCLVCGMAIGGRECMTLVAIDWAATGCSCGTIGAVVFLICAEHPVGGEVSYAQLALDAWHRGHPKVTQ